MMMTMMLLRKVVLNLVMFGHDELMVFGRGKKETKNNGLLQESNLGHSHPKRVFYH